MDDLERFFKTPGGTKPIRLRGPLTSGFRVPKDPDEVLIHEDRRTECSSMHQEGFDYVEEARRLEAEKAFEVNDKIFAQSMESLSVKDSVAQGLNVLDDDALTDVYSKYSFKGEGENKFEISSYKDRIISHVSSQPIVIIRGPTGCGKTTQVPQWVLDDCYEKRLPCKIVVTQPRRIAAISIAKRVAQERGWDVGGIVGYQVGLDNKTTSDTLIQYVTTGVLLQKLVAQKSLGEYTHYIIDEVHERSKDMDFLLLVIKKLLRPSDQRTKLILMSATFDPAKFINYFKHIGPPVTVYIDNKKPMFTVTAYYCDTTKANPAQEALEPAATAASHAIAVKLLNQFDYIDKQEEHYSDDQIPSVLIFLPGINEIDELYNLLHDHEYRLQADFYKQYCDSKWWVLPLHSMITADEQIKVFQRAPVGHRKIILATNIAESSITVPDIKYVIDYCLTKVLVVDDHTNFSSLQLQWASKNNCDQRAGRAGRVRDGRVYRLLTAQQFNRLSPDCVPEIMRSSLDNLILLAKLLEMGSPKHILALALDPPDLSNIHRSILQLKEIGCLKKTLDGKPSELDGDITFLGHICASLPIDVRMSKLIVLGHIFGCLDECITMAAAMSVKSIFSNPFQHRLNSYNSRLTWADGSTSDSIAMQNVYKVWNYLNKNQQFKGKEGNSEWNWAQRFFVQSRVLKELDILVRELYSRLSREGINPVPGGSPWSKNEKSLILKIVLAGAFYPNYFFQSTDEAREIDAMKTLSGHDPRTTVYLQGFPIDQPGELYAASIKKTIRNLIGDEPKVTVDKNGLKVFLTFSNNNSEQQPQQSQVRKANNPMIPGKVLLPVYKAVKIKALNINIFLNMLPKAKSNELYEEMKMKQNVQSQMVPKLPDIDQTCIVIKISQFINVGRFWAQMDDSSTQHNLNTLDKLLNSNSLLANTATVRVGDMFAAPYEDRVGTRMYRARVEKILPNNMVWVLYIDFGSRSRLNTASLFVLPNDVCRELSPLAMECVLAEVSPSLLLDLHGKWSTEATQFFQKIVCNNSLYGKIYSVCNGVISLYLWIDNGRVNVNEELIKNKFAQPADESYESKLNHDRRELAKDLHNSQIRAFNVKQTEAAIANQECAEYEPPAESQCSVKVKLKGPHSPLECKLFSQMYGSKSMDISIEGTSVNSVLIDTEPQSTYDRLLVAGLVSRNEENSRLILRHTTLMPAIPGLPAILAMIFCPTMELRCDAKLTRYVNVLCGLGTHDNGMPFYPEHDMIVHLDVDIDAEDVRDINHIRYTMDNAMYYPEGVVTAMNADDAKKTASNIRGALFRLLRKSRNRREKYNTQHQFDWSEEIYTDMVVHTDPDIESRQSVYPLHSYPVLKPQNRSDKIKLRKENTEMKDVISRLPISSSRTFACKLCGTDAMSVQALRIHLYSQTHRELEDELEIACTGR